MASLLTLVARQLERRQWLEPDDDMAGYVSGTTSPKHNGALCWGPFHTPVRQGIAVFVEFMDGTTRRYVFAVRTRSKVVACVCSANRADAYRLDLAAVAHSWEAEVAPVSEFEDVSGCISWLAGEMGSPGQWVDRSSSPDDSV